MESANADENDEACSTQFFENFAFKESEFRIKQDTFEGHNAVIWDAARVLAKFFECSPENWKGKKVGNSRLSLPYYIADLIIFARRYWTSAADVA